MGDIRIGASGGNYQLDGIGANSDRTAEFHFGVRVGDQMIYLDQKGLDALKSLNAVDKAGPTNETVYKMRDFAAEAVQLNKV